MNLAFPSIKTWMPSSRPAMPLLLAVLLVLSGHLAAAQQVSKEKNRFELVQIDGRVIKSAIRKMTSQAIELEQIGSPRIAFSDLLTLKALSKSAANPLPHQLYLANGDRIFAEIISSDEEYLLARCTPGILEPNQKTQTLRIPIEYLAGVIRQRNLPVAKQSHFSKRLFSRRDNTDLLELKNGDTLWCELLQSNSKSIRLKIAAAELEVPVEKVQFISFNPKYRVQPQLSDLTMQVRLSDNSILMTTPNEKSTLSAKSGYLLCQSVWGAPLYMAWDRIQEIQMLGNRIQSLSDLSPKSYRHTPYIGNPIALQKNRSAVSGPLMINGKYYAKGLGLQSRTELTYQLEKAYQSFSTLIGFDDSAEGLGHAEITIWQNQQQIYSAKLTNRTPRPLAIGPLDLSQAETLIIKIDYGNRGDIMDRVNLCHPVIIRKEKSPARSLESE